MLVALVSRRQQDDQQWHRLTRPRTEQATCAQHLHKRRERRGQATPQKAKPSSFHATKNRATRRACAASRPTGARKVLFPKRLVTDNCGLQSSALERTDPRRLLERLKFLTRKFRALSVTVKNVNNTSAKCGVGHAIVGHQVPVPIPVRPTVYCNSANQPRKARGKVEQDGRH